MLQDSQYKTAHYQITGDIMFNKQDAKMLLQYELTNTTALTENEESILALLKKDKISIDLLMTEHKRLLDETSFGANGIYYELKKYIERTTK